MDCEKCSCPLHLGGRILFGVPFVVFGLMHFMNASAMTGYVPAYIPFATFWVYFTGLAMIAAGVSISINRLASWAALLLGVLLVLYVLTLHLPMVLSGDQAAVVALLKDTALAGGAFFIASTLYTKKS